METRHPIDDARVRDLVLRVLDSGANPEDVCGDRPDLLPEVRRRWERLRAVERRIDALFPRRGAEPAPAVPGPAEGLPHFPGYAVEAVLGRGGMGVVYRARDLHRGRVVALKVIHAHLREVAGFIARLLREAEIGTRVVHENVVRTHGIELLGPVGSEQHVLVMEYVEGQTLRALSAEGRPPESVCRHLGRQVARGLAAIHAVGAVHRDLKPENVLITKQHVVKVMDLGVAKLRDIVDDLSQTGAFVGSMRYAAPEQLGRAARELDGRADLYALGLLLYELATGTHPFGAEGSVATAYSIVHEVPRRASEVNPQVSPFLEEMLAHLLATDPDARPASAMDVAAALERGEESSWWRERSDRIRLSTGRPPRRIEAPRETGLHGRSTDLARLTALFERVRAGEGQVCLIDGEAGIGKSRLLEEFGALLSGQGLEVNFLIGAVAPGGAATASSAFASAYCDHFGSSRLDAEIGARLPHGRDLARSFAAFLRGEPGPGDAALLSREALQTVFVRVAQTLAAQKPTVLVIDDLHFAPAEARALFAALALAVSGHRILLVGTHRPGLDPAWGSEIARLPHVSRFALRRLDAGDVTLLLGELLRSQHLAESLGPRIAERSDGNPYFVLEVVRDLQRSNRLTRTPEGPWAAPQPIHEIESPASVRDLIRARLADLSPEDREALHVAACVGFEFEPLLVAAVIGTEPLPFLRRLGGLEVARRLVRSTGRRYAFDHHQLHEVVYGDISEAHRESYHARIASVLEVRARGGSGASKDLDGALCVDLVHHALRGAEPSLALPHLDAALDHLERRGAHEAVVAAVERASRPGLLTEAKRAEILLRAGRHLAILGRVAEEERSLREAMTLADSLGEPRLRAQARQSLGALLARVSRADEALPLLREAIALAREHGVSAVEANAVGVVGNVVATRGRPDEAEALYRRRLDLARTAADRDNEAGATANLGNLFLSMGRLDEALAQMERAVALYREVGNERFAMHAGGNVANVLATMGRFSEASAKYEECRARSKELGDRMSEARAIGNLAIVHASRGSFRDAKAEGERCLALARECGGKAAEAVAAQNLGAVASALGHDAEAISLIEHGLDVARRIGFRQAEAGALGRMGAHDLAHGRIDRARIHYAAQLALSREIRHRQGEAAALTGLGATQAAAGLVEEGTSHLDAAVSLARLADLPTALVLAAAERAALPGGDAHAAADLLRDFGPRAETSDVLRARWILWKATGEGSHLAEAKRLLDDMVAHAPTEDASSMLHAVPLHREIAEAAARAAPG